MAYEHAKAANQVANALGDILDLLTDNVSDQTQILEILALVSNAVQVAMGPLEGEEQTKFKAKFIAHVGLRLGIRGLDKFVPDEEV